MTYSDEEPLRNHSADGWKGRIIIPTLLAGPPSSLSSSFVIPALTLISNSLHVFLSLSYMLAVFETIVELDARRISGAVGGAAGLVSKNRMTLGIANVSAAYAANLAIIAACYCGAREVARDARKSDPDDLINSAVGGFASGALLGRLQGGQFGAIRYSIIFAVAGTAFDFTTQKLRPILQHFIETGAEEKSQKNVGTSSWWRIPEWSPIQVLDEEALAAKRVREENIYDQRMLGKLKEES